MLPLAEVAVFLLAVLTVGWLWTVAIGLATSAAGIILLRRSGRSGLDRFLAALARDGVGAIHLENSGLATLLGGILLVLPGFITDVLGALLFLPPFRRWARTMIGRARGSRRRGSHGPTVIDLAPDQWHQLPDRPLGRKPRRKRSS
jgi:UPF0716 protein FxsA